jgi:hypothetical protein
LAKSEIFCFEKENEVKDECKQILGCRYDSLPFWYFGFPIHYGKLLNKECYQVDNALNNSYDDGKESCSHI